MHPGDCTAGTALQSVSVHPGAVGACVWANLCRPAPNCAEIGKAYHQVTVIKINAITVSADSGDELARRFAARAGAVDNQDGFEGFELLQPTDERTTWLVITRWRDEETFQAWVSSPAFGHGHRSAAERQGGQAPPHVGVTSELWSYQVAGGAAGGHAPVTRGQRPEGAGQQA